MNKKTYNNFVKNGFCVINLFSKKNIDELTNQLVKEINLKLVDNNFKFTKNKAIRVRVVSTRIKEIKKIFNEPKIKKSLKYLSKFNNFVLIVINNEKSDNIEKDNVILRYYGIGAQIIKDLKVKNMILISRSRKKIIGLEGFGIKIKKQIIIK